MISAPIFPQAWFVSTHCSVTHRIKSLAFLASQALLIRPCLSGLSSACCHTVSDSMPTWLGHPHQLQSTLMAHSPPSPTLAFIILEASSPQPCILSHGGACAVLSSAHGELISRGHYSMLPELAGSNLGNLSVQLWNPTFRSHITGRLLGSQ